MSFSPISNLSSQQQSLRIILNEQQTMSDLQEQLSSGKKTQDLSTLGTTDSRRLLELRTAESKTTQYSQTIATTLPRLQTQDLELTNMTSSVNSVLTSIIGTPNYDVATSSNQGAQIKSYLQQMTASLNENIDGTYLFSGTRYATKPVTDLTSALTTDSPPSEPYPFTPVAAPALPTYDTQAASSPQAAAWASNSAIIGDNTTVNYGISSDNPAFQNMVMGMRWAYAATQDPANYTAYMAKAQDLLTTARNGLNGLQAANGANIATMNTTADNNQTYLSALQTDEDGIQGADKNAVAAQITMLESQIEASYTVTSKIAKLSLVNYL